MELCLWETIASDIFITILTYIDFKETLVTIRRVCKIWCKMTRDPRLWRVIIIRSLYFLNLFSFFQEYYSSIYQNVYKVHVEDWERLFRVTFESNQWFFTGHCSLIDLRGHDRGAQCVQFDDDIIISGGRDGFLCKWSISKKCLIKKVFAQFATVTCLQFNEDLIVIFLRIC